MYTVYGDVQSGNCYKVRLLLSHLDIAHRWIHIDILAGETRTPEFLTLNPNGKIPVLLLGDGEALTESNAILNLLAAGTDYLPDDALGRARVLQWQFFEQYSHEPYIAVARYISRYLGMPPERVEEFDAKQSGGHKALAVMETALAGRDYLAGPRMTIADISLYGYTHVAEEGGFALDRYPAVRRWLDRIAAHSRHVTMSGAS
jgi:glutathione S-transferase